MSDHLGKRLVRMRGDTLLVVDGLYRITLGPDGQLVSDRRAPEEGDCRKLLIPSLADRYRTCGETRGAAVPGPWIRESTIVRIDADRVDSIGPFFMSDGWRSRSGPMPFIQHVRMYGLDRGEDVPANPSPAARPAGAGTSR